MRQITSVICTWVDQVRTSSPGSDPVPKLTGYPTGQPSAPRGWRQRRFRQQPSPEQEGTPTHKAAFSNWFTPTAYPHPGVLPLMRRVVAGVAAVAVTAGLTGLAGVASAAPTDHIQPGDILIASFGDLITSAGVDKMNPKTLEVSDAASLGINDATTNVAATPNGDFFAANLEGDIVRVNHVTGEQKQIRHGFSPSAEFNDLVVDPDGNLIAVLNEQTGPSIVRISAADGHIMQVLAHAGVIDNGTAIAVEHDGSVLIADFEEVLRVSRTGGEPKVLARFTDGSRVDAIAVRSDSAILVRTIGDTVNPKLVKVSPVNGAKTTVSVGNFLSKNFSEGLSMENGTFVVSAEQGSEDGTIVRVNTLTGAQQELLRRDANDVNDVSVATNQIPPTPLPVAGNDTFSMTRPDAELLVGAPGVLANDSDPLGQSVTAELVGSGTHTDKGFVILSPNGAVDYFPFTGFVGTDTYTYRTRAGGRVSAPSTITIEVKPAPLPVAKVDSFFTAATPAGAQFRGNVLTNDTDPLGKALTAELVSPPASGTVSLAQNGDFLYGSRAGFSGIESFQYRAVTSDGRRSAPVNAVITVGNTAPTVLVGKGIAVDTAGRAGTFGLVVSDAFTPAGQLTMSASSSNTALVPINRVTFGGSGANRTVTITTLPGQTGTAVITVRATDPSGLPGSVPITVKVGGTGADTLTGTAGVDLLLGGDNGDTLTGQAGIDLLGGGAGDDKLTGGTGADVFRGHSGTDTVTDFSSSQNDKQSEVP